MEEKKKKKKDEVKKKIRCFACITLDNKVVKIVQNSSDFRLFAGSGEAVSARLPDDTLFTSTTLIWEKREFASGLSLSLSFPQTNTFHSDHGTLWRASPLKLFKKLPLAAPAVWREESQSRRRSNIYTKGLQRNTGLTEGTLGCLGVLAMYKIHQTDRFLLIKMALFRKETKRAFLQP